MTRGGLIATGIFTIAAGVLGIIFGSSNYYISEYGESIRVLVLILTCIGLSSSIFMLLDKGIIGGIISLASAGTLYVTQVDFHLLIVVFFGINGAISISMGIERTQDHDQEAPERRARRYLGYYLLAFGLIFCLNWFSYSAGSWKIVFPVVGLILIGGASFLISSNRIIRYYTPKDLQTQFQFLANVFKSYHTEIETFISGYVRDPLGREEAEDPIQVRGELAQIINNLELFLENSVEINPEDFDSKLLKTEICNYFAALEVLVDFKRFITGIARLLHHSEQDRFLTSIRALWIF